MKKISSQLGLVVVSCLLALSFPVYAAFWIYPQFTKIITFEKEVNAKQIARHITKMLVLDRTNKTLTRDSITDKFIAILQEAKSDFDLTKVKIFSPEGEVLYSSDARDIGKVNTNPYFTDKIAKGNTFSIVVSSDEKTMEEEAINKDVVETYIPLMRGQNLTGVLEVYYDISYADNSINKFTAKAQIINFLLAGLLMLCILLLALAIFRCRNDLRKTREKMEEIKDKIPLLYKNTLDEMDK